MTPGHLHHHSAFPGGATTGVADRLSAILCTLRPRGVS